MQCNVICHLFQGGYRISLIDKEGNTVEDTQSQTVRFSRPCAECTVMLERQALEWGKSYLFRSCGDVNVLQTMPEKLTVSEEAMCSGHGTFVNNKCVCEHGRKGDVCQYASEYPQFLPFFFVSKNSFDCQPRRSELPEKPTPNHSASANCHIDEDCLNGGKCVEELNSIAVASCYCAYGFFGKTCEQSFEHADDSCFAYTKTNDERYPMYGMFNPNCYNREKFSDNDFVYYRKVKSDVEIILDFASTSWVSIGWRPEVLDRSCRLFPDLEGVRQKRAASVEMPPLVAPTPARAAQPSRKDTPPISSQPQDDEVAFDRDHPPAKIAQEGPRPVMPRNNGLLESALRAPLHAMDCIDILVGAVRDGRTRVQDSYSRDRSTPLEDFWYVPIS
ncbi:unnamed protein product [Nippostrongylus brasiliensis]|uniref:EGF-like domain-containing protein n=1 Tax=Nippostrongylus brasiliensis TaxID=27835 RepID=A0A0N4Y483_NIPBR|nr:unnamed protein product [Nippostrongylus brasiliensis]